MANDIVLSAASRSNLLSLQSTQRNIDITQLRLATGKKVNSALDNPQSFFQANSLNNRASDLTRLLDGIGQSIRTIEEADKGITALTSLVEQASSIGESAQAEIRAAAGFASITGTKDLRGIDLTADSGGAIAATNTFTVTIQDADIASGAAQTATITVAANDTVYDLAAKINDEAAIANTNFTNNVRASVDSQGRLKIESLEEGAFLRIADGAAANTLGADGFAFLGLDNLVTTETLNAVAAGRLGGTAVAGRTLISAVSTETLGASGKYTANTTLATAGYVNTGDTVNLILEVDGTSSSAISLIGTTGTIQSLIDGINNDVNINDKVTASFNVDTGRIELAFADNVGTAEITFDATAAGDVVDFDFGTGASDATFTAATDFQSEAFKFIGTSVDLDQYTRDFNKIRSQIDGLVEDANYRGVNLLSGDTLTTFFNEDRSNSLETTGSDLSALGLGLSEADFTDSASVEATLNEVRSALDTVRSFGSSIANDLAIIQTRQTFTQETINTLKAGASDLVNADLNEEGANLLALQTAQQLGVTSLSLASQSQQAVLRLF